MDLLQDEGVYDSHTPIPPPPPASAMKKAVTTAKQPPESVRGSVKRKSYENDENVDSSQFLANAKSSGEDTHPTAAKKVRLESSIPAPSAKTVRSNIPRSGATASSAAANTAAGRRAAAQAQTQAQAQAAQTPKGKSKALVIMPSSANTSTVRAPLSEVSPTLPLSAITPRKLVPASMERSGTAHPHHGAVAETPKISGNMFLKKVQRELVNEVTGSVLSSLLDTHFPPADDRLISINNALRDNKAKNKKWDTKDKTKKLETAVKDLRDLAVSLQESAKKVREQATGFEQRLSLSVREVFDHLMDDAQLIAQLQSSERKTRAELEAVQRELKTETAKFALVKTESVNQLRQLETQMLLREKGNERLQEKLVDLQTQHEKLSKAHDETLLEIRQSQHKQNDEVVKVYQMEIASLTVNTKKLEAEIEKLNREQEEISRKNEQLVESLANTKSSAKDQEMNKDVLEREVQRLTAEVTQLKDNVSKKDDDLRNSMQNVYEIQKQALEEKCAMRQEAAATNLRMQTLEEDRRTLTAQLAAQKEEHSLLQREVELLRESKERIENELKEAEDELALIRDAAKQFELEKELRTRAESREETERRERIAAMGQLVAIQIETSKTVREAEDKVRHLEEQSKAAMDELVLARDRALAEAKANADQALGLKEEIQQLHLALENGPMNRASVEELSRCKGELEVLKQRLAEAAQSSERQSSQDARKLQDLEEKLQVSETLRRKLHNQVQELRGNIRVFARVRPFLPGDGYDLNALPDPCILVRPDLSSLKITRGSQSTELTNTTGSTNSTGSSNRRDDYDFHFDKVFGQACSQETLFAEVAELVQSALDGYQVCLFSYGQTGSGKTHTMNGSGEGSMRGIIPRAMEQVGLYKRALQEKGWQYTMEVSFLEIYNETVRDLLRGGASGSNAGGAITAGASTPMGKESDPKHEIKKDAQGNVYVTDLTRVPVDPEDFAQIMRIMETAAQHRSVSQTLMNDRSSRSHAIFTLFLRACNPAQGVELNGALNLVDLAGSERVDRSGVTGNDLKETVAINKSLSALADVFSALANKQAHVPYRNSKLTYLLQPALSGDGKTLMIVNLSPTEASYFESLSSLRFANQVSQCELGKPKRRVKDVGTESSSSKLVFAGSAREREKEKDSNDDTAVAPTPSKKLTTTWEGASSTRSKLPVAELPPLASSLGTKRTLDSATGSTKIARGVATTASTRAKTAIAATSRAAATPRTPARK